MHFNIFEGLTSEGLTLLSIVESVNYFGRKVKEIGENTEKPILSPLFEI